jgi:hypothetical protein
MPGLSWSDFSPDQLVSVAAAPFLVAMLLRLLLGRTEFTRWAIAVGTMWFAINVLLAPYSTGMRERLMEISNQFR